MKKLLILLLIVSAGLCAFSQSTEPHYTYQSAFKKYQEYNDATKKYVVLEAEEITDRLYIKPGCLHIYSDESETTNLTLEDSPFSKDENGSELTMFYYAESESGTKVVVVLLFVDNILNTVSIGDVTLDKVIKFTELTFTGKK